MRKVTQRVTAQRATWLGAALLAIGVAATAGAAAKTGTGNAANGQKLYAQQGCGACHKIGSKGGKIGPDLSKEGTKHNAQWLVAFLKDPHSKYPKGSMPPVKGTQKELQDLAAYMLTLKK